MSRLFLRRCSAVASAVALSAALSVALVAGPQGSPDVAARLGERVFTVQELDQAWRQFDASAKTQAEQAIYDGRKAALDRLIAGILLDKAAAAKAVTPDAFLKDEVARRKQPVTAADVEAFYNGNKAQMQGRALPDIQDSIRSFLDQQQEIAARAALVAELRKAGPPVRLTIEPPRQPVEITAQDPVRGPASALVTVVEYSDFQCPFCGRVTPTLKRLRDTYGERVRIVWKDFPLVDIHPLAQKAAEAARCAEEQGKYWEYHDRLFANQTALAPDALKQHAVAVGLEPVGFNACLDSGRHATRVRDGIAKGKTLGIDSTPTMFVNGRRVTGAQPYDAFAAIVEDELERVAK